MLLKFITFNFWNHIAYMSLNEITYKPIKFDLLACNNMSINLKQLNSRGWDSNPQIMLSKNTIMPLDYPVQLEGFEPSCQRP